MQNDLQAGRKIPKWEPRARLGIYLGPSATHARTFARVLNPATGHVSPQFHVSFDDPFITTNQGHTEGTEPSLWKALAGFRHATRNDHLPLFQENNDNGGEDDIGMVPLLPTDTNEQDEPLADSMPPPTSSIAHDRPTREPQPIERLTYDSNAEHTSISLHALREEHHLSILSDPIAYMASNNKDTMYLHQAKGKEDWKQF